MKCGSQIAVAVVGGYVLGRSKKTRMALLLALMAAGGGKLPIGPEDLLRKSPLGGPLDKLTGDLRSQIVDAGMNVAKKAASSRIDSLSDRLQERADTLRRTGGRADTESEESEESEEEPIRGRRDRGAPPRRRREEPPRRARKPEYDEDEYDEYDDYDRDEDDDYEQDDYDRDDYEEPEPEPEPETERRRRPPVRSTRPEPRRRAPRRDDDRPMGRSPR
jgi:hypothetical protein